jgi:hypothetical protein
MHCAVSSDVTFSPVFVGGTAVSDVYLSLLSVDVLRHSNEFSLVSTRWCQTLHQLCRTSLSLWCFRGQGPVEPVYYSISGSVFVATNRTGLKFLQLFSVGVFEGGRVTEKCAHNSGTANCYPIKDCSHFYRHSDQGYEQSCPSFPDTSWSSGTSHGKMFSVTNKFLKCRTIMKGSCNYG